MLVYEMKPICYNMYKWGVQTDVGGGGAITENSRENNPILIVNDLHLNEI